MGLLGSSLAMALRGRGDYEIYGYARRPAVVDWALANQVADFASTDPVAVIREADLTVLALPIPQIIAFMRQHCNEFKPGGIVTDIGSIKGDICRAALECFKGSGVCFVGSHPMAGTEKSGPMAAFKSLYDNAEVFVCPVDGLPSKNGAGCNAVDLVADFWRSINTKVVKIEPGKHDKLVSHTSHLLHILAMSLTIAVLESGSNEENKLRLSGCATGFKDTSRIASSSPRMWREIIEHNQAAVLSSLDDFERQFRQVRQLIEEKKFDEFEEMFAHGKELRDGWVEYKNNRNKLK